MLEDKLANHFADGWRKLICHVAILQEDGLHFFFFFWGGGGGRDSWRPGTKNIMHTLRHRSFFNYLYPLTFGEVMFRDVYNGLGYLTLFIQ